MFPAPGPLRTREDPLPATRAAPPDRFVVLGYQGGQRVLLEAGKPIPATLPVGPAFDDAPLPETAPGGLPLDAGMSWLVDFAEAEKVGMGIRVALTPSSRPATLDTLLVLGVNAQARARGRQRGARGAARRAALHARARVPRARARRRTTRPRAAPASAAATARRRRASRASRARRRAARRPRSPRACSASGPRRSPALDGAARTEELDARHLQTALWPVTGGYYLDQIMGSPEGQPATFTRAQLDAARRHFVDNVRALGPAPDACAPAGSRTACCRSRRSSCSPPGPPAGPLRPDPQPLLRARGRRRCRRAPPAAGAAEADALVEVLRLQPASVGLPRAARVRSALLRADDGVSTSQLEPDLQGHATVIRARLQPATTGGLAARRALLRPDPGSTSRAPLRAPLVTRGGSSRARARAATTRVAPHRELRRPPQRAPPGRASRRRRSWTPCSTSCCATRCCSPTATSRGGSWSAAARCPQRYREPALVDITGGAVPDRTPTLPARSPPTGAPGRASTHSARRRSPRPPSSTSCAGA